MRPITIKQHLDGIKTITGVKDDADVKRVMRKFIVLERRAHKIAEEYASGEDSKYAMGERGFEEERRRIIAEAKDLTRGIGLIFFNSDPRGYALKVENSIAEEYGLIQDWGGNGIIAPDEMVKFYSSHYEGGRYVKKADRLEN